MTVQPFGFDVAPFALPNCSPGEVRFEEPREVVRVVAHFGAQAPADARLEYLHKYWPEGRWRLIDPLEDPCWYGWIPTDDMFNSSWRATTADVRAEGRNVEFIMRDYGEEDSAYLGEGIRHRKTLGLRVVSDGNLPVERIEVYTTGLPRTTRLRIESDAGAGSPGEIEAIAGYNATPGPLRREGPRSWSVSVNHLHPGNPLSGDDGLLTVAVGNEKATISLSALEELGPVWVEHLGLFVKPADDPTTFEQYRANQKQMTLNARVLEHREQSFAGACNGQPRPHPCSTNLGLPNSRHRFRLEANADLVLEKLELERVPAADLPRFKSKAGSRVFFGLERWTALARYPDPAPVMAYNQTYRKGPVEVQVRSFAVPLAEGPRRRLRGDETTAALMRFRFTNRGTEPATAELPIAFAQDTRRSENAYADQPQDDYLVPYAVRDALSVEGGIVTSEYEGKPVCRVLFDAAREQAVNLAEDQTVLSRTLQPGETADIVLRVPFVEPTETEVKLMRELDFDRCDAENTAFWRSFVAGGAQIHTPVPQLDDLHAAHVAHVGMTDFEMPDGSGLINTSVGTSTYGNYSNESCMIVHDLDERGLHDEARRRLDLWIRYQGTAPQPGNFTDFDGMFYGAGGYETGAYNQHHGWVLWAMAEHYLLTGDDAWLTRSAKAIAAGADWVFRQRQNTMGDLPHSRGFERGFLPAGSLEDVEDYHYWLSTNAVTWRGTNAVAEAFEAAGLPDAERLRRESDAYGDDLRRGFERMRELSPVVRLRDGRWVPHYPSRVYRRGRDLGWIRETLEGAFFLPATGLFDANDVRGAWILDDYQDNRYARTPYGYLLSDFDHNWFDRGGFSIQPLLMAGLMPHLDRDEPEIYIWMFFNALAACYREEIGAVVEHPAPVLGYSNAAQFKTSDQANATSWLRSMFVYSRRDLLHFGRAIPREWLGSQEGIGLWGVSTPFGGVAVSYKPEGRRIVANVELDLREPPEHVLIRFRHPERMRIRQALIDGKPVEVRPNGEDVALPSLSGAYSVEADFEPRE
jgi:hypothetical protein